MSRADGTAGADAAPDVRYRFGAFARDPVLLALVTAGVAIVLWANSGAGGPATQARLFWAVQVPLDLSLCLLALRVAALPGIPAAPRRFWRVLGLAAGCWFLGDAVQAGSALYDPRASSLGGGFQNACFLLGLFLLLWFMLRYPAAESGRRQRWQFYLDATAVLVAGGVLAWCFQMDPSLPSGTDPFGAAIGTGMMLVAAFAGVKMVLGGWAPMTGTAAMPMIASGLLQGIAACMSPADPGTELPPWLMVLRLLPSALMAMGPRIQYLQADRELSCFAPRPPKPYSLLPYAAITAALTAMITTLWDQDAGRRVGAVAGTVAITALVVARQLLAFQENVRLIGRLDNALVDLQTNERKLRVQASTDALTGLANRTAFAERAAAALAGPDRAGVALLMIGLDNFKAVNDTLGHHIGDAVLIAVGQRLRGAVAPGDVVARVGGDEFGVLLHRAGGPGAEQAAKRVLSRLSPSVQVGRHELLVRASVGLARVAGPAWGEQTEVDLASLVQRTNIAMCAVKDRGKSGWAEFSAEMSAKVLETARLGAQMREALTDGQFRLVYQPIVELPTGRIVGVEALVRWYHPDRGLIPPNDFIPAAEATGLIVPLGRWVLWEACRAAAGWPGRADDGVRISVSVNVACRQLQEEGFVAEVAQALDSAGLPAERLTIEATETALLGDAGVVRAMNQLRDLGIRLALDDFGTAASSLGLVLTCPMTSLKLDRSFVEKITTVERQEAVATAVIQMAQALQLTAVAEGIETRDQANLLYGLGYRLAQGYLYAKPLSPEDLVANWLTAGTVRRGLTAGIA